MTASEIGKLGELTACRYLSGTGFEVLRQNYRSRQGEVDIIASDNQYIIFAEVKTRKPDSVVSGIDAVDPKKRRRLYLAATKYMMEVGSDRQPRFDVISIVAEPFGETLKIHSIEHFTDVFGAEVCDEVF
ncbi:MAG: YraN family protein [Oscillospiraceae bacterium]|nr:YraN family protein [Oscillospiraceae bacterium]